MVSVAIDTKIVCQACATLMRMPAVAAIFEKAMVDKRVRVEEDEDYEQPARSAKQPRTQGPATRSGNAGSSKSMAPPQILTDTSPEPDSESEEDVPIVLERPRARPETVYVAPSTGISKKKFPSWFPSQPPVAIVISRSPCPSHTSCASRPCSCLCARAVVILCDVSRLA